MLALPCCGQNFVRHSGRLAFWPQAATIKTKLLDLIAAGFYGQDASRLFYHVIRSIDMQSIKGNLLTYLFCKPYNYLKTHICWRDRYRWVECISFRWNAKPCGHISPAPAPYIGGFPTARFPLCAYTLRTKNRTLLTGFSSANVDRPACVTPNRLSRCTQSWTLSVTVAAPALRIHQVPARSWKCLPGPRY